MTAFPPTPSFRYLAGGGDWPGLTLLGLVIRDGRVELPVLPAPDPSAAAVAGEAALEGPARVAVAPDGTVYVADPDGNRILRVACDGSVSDFGCSTPGDDPILDHPRGVLVGPHGAIYVADTGHHRIVLFDAGSGGIIGVWGQPSPSNAPAASLADGRFQSPWDLAADSRGRVYVADAGTQDAAKQWSGGRVQRFDAYGRVEPGFWSDVSAGTPPRAPVAIAIVLLDGNDPSSERLLVLDRSPARLLVYTLDGALDVASTALWETVAQAIGTGGAPVDLAWGDAALYVADANTGDVLVFSRSGAFLGTAASSGLPAGLAIDRDGRILMRPSNAAGVERLLANAAHAASGAFVAGPFEAPRNAAAWHRVTARVDGLDENTHMRLYTWTADDFAGPDTSPAATDLLLALSPDLSRSAFRTPAAQWRPTPWDAADALVLNAPARYLWIAGTFHGSGSASPSMSQLCVEHGHDGLLDRLPAIYRRDPSRDALRRVLALADTTLEHEDVLIDGLPALFDPAAAPLGDANGSWLAWLGEWLDFAIDSGWSEADSRRWLAGAFALFARRGTPSGLVELIRMYAGVDARIYEPARARGVLSLGVASTLGESTTLSAFEAQGAVLDTTAAADRSHLIAEEDYGAPVFADLAHHIVVSVAGANARAVARVRETLDREKPAHVTYEVCVVQPALRVGSQARVGIDAIVGRAPSRTSLDGDNMLGFDTAFPVRQRTGVVGDTARVGRLIT